MKKHNTIFLIITIALAMLFCSGCSNKSSNKVVNREYDAYGSYAAEEAIYDYDYEASYDTPAMASDMNSSAYDSKAASANSSTASVPRMVRKSANINIQVMDPVQAAETIVSMTEQMGGFVVSYTNSQEYYSGDIYLPKADLSIRVPSERLMEVLESIENLTTDKTKYVSNKRVYGVDITAEYVDSNSRLESLEKTRDKLYEILDKAVNAEEALDVYSSISDVETEIEVLKGQIKYMEESVALSSVDIKITSVKPAPIQTVQKWEPGEVIKDAFEELLDTGKSVIEGLIYFLIVGVPVLVLIAIPIVLIVWLIKKLVKRSKAKKTARGKTEDTLTKVEDK